MHGTWVPLICLRNSRLGAEEEASSQCPGRRGSMWGEPLLTIRFCVRVLGLCLRSQVSGNVSDRKTLNQSPEKPGLFSVSNEDSSQQAAANCELHLGWARRGRGRGAWCLEAEVGSGWRERGM